MIRNINGIDSSSFYFYTRPLLAREWNCLFIKSISLLSTTNGIAKLYFLFDPLCHCQLSKQSQSFMFRWKFNYLTRVWRFSTSRVHHHHVWWRCWYIWWRWYVLSRNQFTSAGYVSLAWPLLQPNYQNVRFIENISYQSNYLFTKMFQVSNVIILL